MIFAQIYTRLHLNLKDNLHDQNKWYISVFLASLQPRHFARQLAGARQFKVWLPCLCFSVGGLVHWRACFFLLRKRRPARRRVAVISNVTSTGLKWRSLMTLIWLAPAGNSVGVPQQGFRTAGPSWTFIRHAPVGPSYGGPQSVGPSRTFMRWTLPGPLDGGPGQTITRWAPTGFS